MDTENHDKNFFWIITQDIRFQAPEGFSALKLKTVVTLNVFGAIFNAHIIIRPSLQ